MLKIIDHNPKKQIILYDGICNLCNGIVNFIKKMDKSGKFSFESLQSDSGQGLLIKFDIKSYHLDSLVFIRKNVVYMKSTAVLKILKELGGFWRFLYVFIILPKSLRDFIYILASKSRYRIFGKLH